LAEPTTPDISVIIPTYNSQETIVNCLESLKNQKTEKRFEVIVVDSSSDNTLKLIKEAYSNASVYHFSERKYAGGARNVGIAHSRAPIIAFMDSDCTVDEDWIDQVIDAHRGDYDVVGGTILNGESRSIVGWAYYFCEFNLWLPKMKVQEIPEIAGCCLSMKRTIFDKYGPFIEGTYCSDTAFHHKLLQDDIKVLLVPSIKVYHNFNLTVGSFLSHIYDHRYHFARIMIRMKRLSDHQRKVFILFSPFYPVILFLVVLKRVLSSGFFVKEFFGASPLVFAGLVARFLGEIMGYHRS
jgi:GT2 family glycosyltransferase